MKDKDKTKEQLINELAELRQRIAELEASETEHKRVQEALRESEEKLRHLFESVTDGIFAMDLNGAYTEFNQRILEMHGLSSKEEILGKSSFELIAPRDAERAMGGMQEALEQGAVVRQEFTALKADGSEFPVEVSGAVLKDASGNPVGIIGITRDITERKRAERAVQEAREYAESIVDTVREPLVVLDAGLRLISASRSFYQTFQMTPEETERQLLYDLCNRQWDIPRLRELLEKVLPENTVFDDFEVEHDFPTLGRRTMLLNAQRIYRTANETQLILLAIEDITERKRAEEELKEYSERLEEIVEERTRELRDAQEQLIRREKLAVLGQLAGGVGHELRNPLGAIKNAAYFLNMVLEEPESEVKEALEIMAKEVATSEKIISSLLDFARAKPPTRRKVDVNDLVRNALSRATVPEKVEVVTQLEELPAILADPDQLGQVFANIILNGFQAMPEGGQLVVKTSEVSEKPPRSGWVAVSFADTGVGIPEENLGKLFEPLFTTKAKGIGLGLAVTRTLVEGHGGTIEIQSPSTLRRGSGQAGLRTGEVGKGSTFTVRLPIGRGPALSEAEGREK
jgi:PAS domain S-box-containing protein